MIVDDELYTRCFAKIWVYLQFLNIC